MAKRKQLVMINGVLTSVKSQKKPKKSRNPALQDLRTNPHFIRRPSTKTQKDVQARGDTWDRGCKHREQPNAD